MVAVNPPSLVWKSDARAKSYVVELSPVADFSREVVTVSGVPYAYYNHHEPLAPGKWHWRHAVVTPAGEVSRFSAGKSFVVEPTTLVLPLPDAPALLASLAPHPRIFTTPGDLKEFRARRNGVGRTAWEQVRLKAEEILATPVTVLTLRALPERLPDHRRQVFVVRDGVASIPENYGMLDMVRDAERANLLSFAYLISGDERYAQGAKAWALLVADLRMDHHLKTLPERGQHDTVVYAYERGLKGLALVFDRLHARLSPAERRVLLDHIEYHGEAAMHWIREVMALHLNFQDSHGQQCMHFLLTTALAIAGDSPKAAEWIAYMVPQYANRIPWMSEDGGYFEGQAYVFKLSFILEALAALRSATGVDLFQKPEIRNAGDFFLYCQSLNYWWPHWGDTMGLWFPYGNVGDGFMAAVLAAMTDNRPLQWWAGNVPASDATPPFGYLAATGVVPQPPVAMPQARAFRPTGVVAAFDRHYDQGTTRLFFRSSPWGGESHAHADQNSFVLHRGGEILAADTGYYTYYGDENYNRVATQTIAHNSILVDGKGQTNDSKGEGRITGFFNSPRYAFMAGDASKAYDGAMDYFRRDLLYLRPGLIVIADELRAPQPAEFTWILNAFVAPAIDETKREFTVTEGAEALVVKHLFPENLRYEASNEKLAPRKTRQWTRFTEAFPEPWRVHAITGKAAETDLFTLLQTGGAEQFETVAATRDAHGSAVKLKTADGVSTILIRRRLVESGSYGGLDLQTDARAAAVDQGSESRLVSWVAVEATTLSLAGEPLFRADAPVSLAWEPTPVAQALVTVHAPAATRVSLPLKHQPAALMRTKPAVLEQARPHAMQWADGWLTFAVPAGESAVLIEPREFLGSRPATLFVEFRSADDARAVGFETAVADNGDWVAYGTLTPSVPGFYEIRGSDPALEILVSDRWDPERSVRGRGAVRALVGQQTEIILRFPAAAQLPKVTAALVEAIPLNRINLLRNGDCETGLPGFPPRGWTVQNGCSSETYGSPGEQGWPGWSQEQAASGRGSLKFIRPLNHTVDWRPPFPVLARDQMVALAPPVRLLAGGKYVLTCKTKGTATTAAVEIESSAGVVQRIAVRPSGQWESHRLEVELPAGYTLVRVKFSEGGRDDQLLWADDFFLAPAGGQ